MRNSEGAVLSDATTAAMGGRGRGSGADIAGFGVTSGRRGSTHVVLEEGGDNYTPLSKPQKPKSEDSQKKEVSVLTSSLNYLPFVDCESGNNKGGEPLSSHSALGRLSAMVGNLSRCMRRGGNRHSHLNFGRPSVNASSFPASSYSLASWVWIIFVVLCVWVVVLPMFCTYITPLPSQSLQTKGEVTSACPAIFAAPVTHLRGFLFGFLGDGGNEAESGGENGVSGGKRWHALARDINGDAALKELLEKRRKEQMEQGKDDEFGTPLNDLIFIENKCSKPVTVRMELAQRGPGSNNDDKKMAMIRNTRYLLRAGGARGYMKEISTDVYSKAGGADTLRITASALKFREGNVLSMVEFTRDAENTMGTGAGFVLVDNYHQVRSSRVHGYNLGMQVRLLEGEWEPAPAHVMNPWRRVPAHRLVQGSGGDDSVHNTDRDIVPYDLSKCPDLLQVLSNGRVVACASLHQWATNCARSEDNNNGGIWHTDERRCGQFDENPEYLDALRCKGKYSMPSVIAAKEQGQDSDVVHEYDHTKLRLCIPQNFPSKLFVDNARTITALTHFNEIFADAGGNELYEGQRYWDRRLDTVLTSATNSDGGAGSNVNRRRGEEESGAGKDVDESSDKGYSNSDIVRKAREFVSLYVANPMQRSTQVKKEQPQRQRQQETKEEEGGEMTDNDNTRNRRSAIDVKQHYGSFRITISNC
eukprot:Nk52_evm4s2650 gene=Nk52_evmTU4s2650